MTDFFLALLDLLIKEVGADALHAKIDERMQILAARDAADAAEKALTGVAP